jgi:hypothetical protein
MRVLVQSLLVLCALPAFAASYNLKELKPMPGGNFSDARSINASGYVAGAASDKSFLWASMWFQPDAGPVAVLGNAASTNEFFSINATGDLVGMSQFASDGGMRPILNSGSLFTLLPTPGYSFGIANGVSDRFAYENTHDANSIVGAVSKYTSTDWQRAVAWTRNGQMTVLDTVDTQLGTGELTVRNGANSIDHFGLIGGYSSKKGSLLEWPVVWGIDTSSIVTQAGVDAGHGGYGGGINDVRDSRYFAGYFYPKDVNPTNPGPSNAVAHACYWENPGSPQDIGKAWPSSSGAMAVRDHYSTLNQRPELVGWRQGSGGHPVAMRWDPDHGMQDLESLVSTLGAWQLWTAFDVAPDGRIVGQGLLAGQERGFILIPIAVKMIHVPPFPIGGGVSAQASIDLLDEAEQDVIVRLESSNPAAVLPRTVTVPRGRSSVSFTIQTQRVRAAVDVTATATLDEQVQSARFTVSP